MQMVVIASSPRVGSSLISDLLTQAEAGYVAEHFNLSVHVPRVAKENGLRNLQEHFDFIVKNYKSSDGSTFSVKSHFDQFFNYGKKVDIFSRFEKTIFIQVKRRNSLDQALSYFLAKVTDTWSSKNIDDIRKHNKKLLQALRNTPSENIYKEIMRMSFRLKQNEAFWDFYLKDQENDIFYYEDLLTEEGIQKAETAFSDIYKKEVQIDRHVSSMKMQRDDEISNLIKNKIATHLESPPPLALFDGCMQFNNSFYGYGKS